MPADPSVVTGYTTTLCYLLPFLPLPVTLTAPARLYILAVIQVQYSTLQCCTVQYTPALLWTINNEELCIMRGESLVGNTGGGWLALIVEILHNEMMVEM